VAAPHALPIDGGSPGVTPATDAQRGAFVVALMFVE
jgi:hypothetical protein